MWLAKLAFHQVNGQFCLSHYLKEHDVDVGDSAPIKQHPYRVSPMKKELLDKEVQYMLENDIIEESQSNWSSKNDLGTKLSHLPLVQRKELAEVITQYREVFPDVPSKTNLIEHDVDVGDSAPIKQHPYRVSPMKKELLDKEVQYMLENDIIEESQSNWSSPCILVPKHDGGFRFCTDFAQITWRIISPLFQKV